MMQTLAYFAVFGCGCLFGVWGVILITFWASYAAWQRSDEEKFLAEKER